MIGIGLLARACAAAGLLWCLVGFAGLAAAQPYSAERASLEQELGQLNDRIEEAGQLLQQADASGGLLVANGLVMVVVERDQLVQWATDMIYYEGTGSDSSVGREAVLRRVQQIAARSRPMIEALRRAWQEDGARRQLVQRELVALRRAEAGTAGPVASGGCGFPHSWRVDLAGRGSHNLAMDAAGNVTTEGGGQATLAGNRLTIAVAHGGDVPISARYVVTLDGSCNGTGQLILDSADSRLTELGIRSGQVIFTSLGAGPP